MNEIKPRKKNGFSMVVVGRQGSGKTPFIKSIADKFRNKIVYDIRQEYDKEQWTTFRKFANFKEYIYTVTDSLIVAEEATGFINGFKDMEFAEMIASVEHNTNVLIFVFHSISDIPLYMDRMSRFFYILPTNDDIFRLKSSRPFYYNVLKSNKLPVLIDKNSFHTNLNAEILEKK